MESTPPAMPSLCRSGCGFYGSPAMDGLCSKCFKDSLKQKNDPGGLSAQTAGASSLTKPSGGGNSSVDPTLPSTSSTPEKIFEDEKADPPLAPPTEAKSPSSASSPEGLSPSAAVTQKKNRCHVCKKKVGLTGFECRCGGLYCGTHRYSDAHSCQFDYRTMGQDEIRRNNPLVKGEKIVKL